MHRLMIVDASSMFAQAVAKQLIDELHIQICERSDQAVEMIRTFDPDILLLDIMMPDLDGMRILHALRTSGRNTKVIALSFSANESVTARLAQYNVSSLLTRPCTVGMAVCQIREVLFRLERPDIKDWCLENETDGILLALGFHMGPSRYRCVYDAVLARYRNPDCSMKELYIDVAKTCGGNYQRVEKAIRDAIEAAYDSGEKDLWSLYFSPNSKRDKPYPGNEDFIARVAGCLVQMTRIRKPCPYISEKAQ
mgnify:CR=1 FL=1